MYAALYAIAIFVINLFKSRQRPEQTSNVKSRMTRLHNGEGRVDGEERQLHPFDPPGNPQRLRAVCA